jgi:hypothetical protein
MSIPFHVRFINDINDKSRDDILNITQNSDGTYQWLFTDSSLVFPHTVVLAKSYDVYDRLQNLLEMVSLDRQAASDIQVDAPGYPTALIPTCDLAKYSRAVLESLHLTMKAWPSRKSLCKDEDDDMPPLVPISSNKRHCNSARRSERLASRTSTHQFFDE